jgi:hypothetical protein
MQLDSTNNLESTAPIEISDRLTLELYDEGHADARYALLTYGNGQVGGCAVVEETELDNVIAALQQIKVYFQANPISSEN